MLSPSYLIFRWPGRGLVRSSAIVATPHRHEALQVTLVLDGPGPVRSLEEFERLDSGYVHEINGRGGGGGGSRPTFLESVRKR